MNFAKQIETDGVAVVPAFLSNEDAANLRRFVFHLYDLLERSPIHDDGLRDNFERWRGIWVKPVSDFLAEQPDTLATFDMLCRKIEENINSLFDSRWTMARNFSFFRRHIGSGQHLPWHIDADAANMGAAPSINAWLPLDTVGKELPSLEVIPKSNAVMRTMAMVPAPEAYRSDEFSRNINLPVAPELALGDALVFDSFTLHRTQPIGNGATRTSCEFRFYHN